MHEGGEPLRLCKIEGAKWKTAPTPCPTKWSTTPYLYMSVISLQEAHIYVTMMLMRKKLLQKSQPTYSENWATYPKV